jgi:hypothetical protein
MYPLRPQLKTGCHHTRHNARSIKRPKAVRAGVTALGLALCHFLTLATTACGQNDSDERMLRGRGPLVSEFETITACETTVYDGSETPLYSNRPYHTAAPVAAVQGLEFCRAARHGTNVWILEISRPTTLVAFGNRAFGLERRGWTLADAPVLVEAAGMPLDGIYTRRFETGRFVIRQGFTRSAPIVFWDPEVAQINAAIPQSTDSAHSKN